MSWRRHETTVQVERRPLSSDSPPARHAPGHSSRLLTGRLSSLAAAVVVYASCTALLYRQVLFGLGSSLLDTRDELLYLWWWSWIPHAILHGHNPLVTTAMNYPVGGNGMWNVTVPLLAVLMSPVTLTAGPVVATNLALVLGPFVSALVAYLVIRRYTRTAPPAVAGGLAYGFSPFFIGHGSGHISLMWGFFPPLLVYFLDEILVQQRRRPAVIGALLGVTCAAQLLVSNELLLLGAVVAVVAVVVIALHRPTEILRRAPYVAKATVTGAVVAIALSAWPLWVTAFGPHRPKGAVQPAGIYVSDLLGFIVPTASHWLNPAIAQHVSRRIVDEPTAYIGVPLLILLVAFGFIRRRQPLVRMAALIGLLTAVLSLGPWLHIGGTRYKTIPLPWALLQRSPLFENALPGRLSLFVAMCVAMLLALALDAFGEVSVRRRVLGWAVTALAFVPLVPVTFNSHLLPPTPALFTTNAVTRIPQDAVVVIEPYANAGDVTALLWQSEARMRFLMPGGLVATDLVTREGYWDFGPAPSTLRDISIRLQSRNIPRLTPKLRTRLLVDLSRIRARMLVVGPSYFEEQQIVFFGRLLGERPVHVAGAWVFDLGQLDAKISAAAELDAVTTTLPREGGAAHSPR